MMYSRYSPTGDSGPEKLPFLQYHISNIHVLFFTRAQFSRCSTLVYSVYSFRKHERVQGFFHRRRKNRLLWAAPRILTRSTLQRVTSRTKQRRCTPRWGQHLIQRRLILFLHFIFTDLCPFCHRQLSACLLEQSHYIDLCCGTYVRKGTFHCWINRVSAG